LEIGLEHAPLYVDRWELSLWFSDLSERSSQQQASLIQLLFDTYLASKCIELGLPLPQLQVQLFAGNMECRRRYWLRSRK
jgi:hypothetical protein